MPLIPYQEVITTNNPAHDIAELVLKHRREKHLKPGQNVAGYAVYNQNGHRVFYSVRASWGQTDGTPGHHSSHPDQKCLSDIKTKFSCKNDQELRQKIEQEKLEIVFYSERGPCPDCAKYINTALGETFINKNTFYSVEYSREHFLNSRNQSKSVMQDAFETELETLPEDIPTLTEERRRLSLSSEGSPVHKRNRLIRASDFQEDDASSPETTSQVTTRDLKSSSSPAPPRLSEGLTKTGNFLGFSAFASHQNRSIPMSGFPLPIIENESIKTQRLKNTYEYLVRNKDQETISAKKIFCAIGLHTDLTIAQALSEIEVQSNQEVLLNAFSKNKIGLTALEYSEVLTDPFLVGEKVAQCFSQMHDLVQKLETMPHKPGFIS